MSLAPQHRSGWIAVALVVSLVVSWLGPLPQAVAGPILPGPIGPPGVETDDTWLAVEVTISSTATHQLSRPLTDPGDKGEVEAIEPRSSSFAFHLDAGFDRKDHLILRFTPSTSGATDWIGSLADVAAIATVDDQLFLYDAFGSQIPFTRPDAGPATNPLSLLAPFTRLDLTAGLVTADLALVAGDGAIEYPSADNALITNTLGGPTGSTVRRLFVQRGEDWVIKELAVEETTSDELGAVLRVQSFAFEDLVWNVNEAENARRAALPSPSDPPRDDGQWAPLAMPPQPAEAPDEDSAQLTQASAFGQNVVFQHGILSSGNAWYFMDPALSSQFILGTKLRPSLDWTRHLNDQAASLTNQIQATGESDFLLIGHSQGGLVARRTAQDRPDLVRGVVTFGTPHQGARVLAIGRQTAIELLVPQIERLLGFCNSSATACFIGNAIASVAVDLLFNIVLDATLPDFADLVPGSGFLAEVNSNPEPFTKVGIENVAFKRWLWMRLLGDAVCLPTETCNGRNLAFFTELAYLGFRFCELIALEECFRCGVPTCDSCQVAVICGRIGNVMDSIDERFNFVVSDDDYLGFPFLGGDGIVNSSSQLYPGADARYAILGGDAHPGETDSDLVLAALTAALDQQFQVPRQGTGFPAPAITSLQPATVAAGGGDFLLTVSGTGFGTFSTLRVNGQARSTSYQSQAQTLTTTILRANIAQAGMLAVSVLNPAPGGGESTSRTLTITGAPSNPVPALASIAPSSIAAGSTNMLTLTLQGSSFVAGAVGRIQGADRATTFHSPSELTMTLLAGDVAIAGTRSIVAVNPGPGGGPSNALTLQITSIPPSNPVPQVSGLSPAAVQVGSPATTLHVFGFNFVAGAVIEIDNGARSTLFVSANELTTELPGSFFASASNHGVTVLNPTPGGGRSGVLSFEVTSSPPSNPLPVLTALTPSSAVAGSPELTLIVQGSGFIPESVVRWDGSGRTTFYVAPDQLRATIPASDLATAGTVEVKVRNPTPGGGTSGGLLFTISTPPTNPAPVITAVSPSSVPAGSPATVFTVTGSGFIEASSGRWNSDPRSTVFVSASELRVTLTADDLAAIGSGTLKVRNPEPGGGTSGGLTVTITTPPPNPVPAMQSISPSQVFAAGPGFTLVVQGSGFVPASRVKVGGEGRDTTYVSATQLLAEVLASDIELDGQVNVKVKNPEPGGGTSNAVPLTVLPNPMPQVTSISPAVVEAGGPNFTLIIEGQGFVPASFAKVGGSNRATVLLSPTRLQVTVLAADIAVPGPVNVKVKTPSPGGGTSNTVVLDVQ